ncbi:MAG: glycosyltransferase [Aestuariivita sp.]|uniref:glycosyltransferase family 2 protein n=1 Tax=Aestuariivita sp. TaxID=1872407 RepID=UPI003BAF0383
MTHPPVSVIVVSRNRPEALIRCLTGISQLRYPSFEVIVVADKPGLEAVRRWPSGADVKALSFNEPNISVARNIGIEAASAEIVAFIDDDAVPEPGWLGHLVKPFGDPATGAAGGFVRGRNGISWQWQAQSVDLAGRAQALDIKGDDPVVLTPSPGRAIKTEGTNMALRRSIIARIGGFDPNYHYFLDETDVNLRLAAAGVSTAIVPLAVVHHGYEQNATRRQDRVPRDLTQMGASWAVFLARHCPDVHSDERWRSIVMEERRRLLRYMVEGRLEPRDVRQIMAGLRKGFAEGSARVPSDLTQLGAAPNSYRPFPSKPDRKAVTLSGRIWSRKALRQKARDAALAGDIPSVFVFSPTMFYHRRIFHPEGYWEQRGGLFGKSLRTDPGFRLWMLRRRVAREEALWSKYQ